VQVPVQELSNPWDVLLSAAATDANEGNWEAPDGYSGVDTPGLAAVTPVSADLAFPSWPETPAELHPHDWAASQPAGASGAGFDWPTSPGGSLNAANLAAALRRQQELLQQQWQ